MDKVIEILKEAQKGEGAYNRDVLVHAENTIIDILKKELGENIISWHGGKDF